MSLRVSKPILVALIIACAMFMENLDGTVITTALPEMAKSFGTNPIRLSLGITAYMLSLAVFIPISGWIADRFGARTIFSAAIGVFTLGSILCGISQNVPEFVGARVLQGIGGAMMVPVGRLVLLRSCEKSELVRAMSYLMVPAMIGPVVGPPLGGFITTFASWHWIFFLNVPVGLLGIVLVQRFIENHREPATAPLDWWGFVLTGLSLSCLMYGLELVGRPEAGAAQTLGFLGAGLAIGLPAVRHALKHPQPLVDLALLRVPTFGATVIGGSLFRIGVGAIPFLVPLMLQVGFGMDAFSSGLLTFAAAAGSLTMKMSGRPILKRFGFRAVLVVNGAISAFFMMICALFTPATPAVTIFVLLLAGGFFRSLEFTSLNTLAFADVSSPKMSAATSLSSMVQQVSLGTGVALGAILLHLHLMLRDAPHGPLGTGDFHFAFVIIGLISLAAVALFMRLAPDAGAELSGHRPRGFAPERAPAAGDD
ncbi:MFS transporter [Aliidongia dinghuensis]|uniref:MFS transporter n=1 Tax=Aliidongia dinghuensis TaxID=1867774 RepID=A0A8J3E179_9PROT|nr:MFS transporter [Aliidongia dinghuensis]GGE99291.1 MFS transporter [Aliidongia dinghuensis]